MIVAARLKSARYNRAMKSVAAAPLGARSSTAGWSAALDRAAPLPERWIAARSEIVSGGRTGGFVLAFVLVVAYLTLAQFVLRVNDPQQVGMNFWPSAGLTLGALLLLPTRRWVWA